MVIEDDVDPESLQAQIDTTMSFAHNLVMSWIKPGHHVQVGPSVNATQVLEDELRRPPRLGVGASIPATSPLTHEASRLTRRLGKYGAKAENAMESQQQVSDDEEHKGRPTKRKLKADPFGREGGKKKRKANLDANPCPPVKDASIHPASRNSTLGDYSQDSFPFDRRSHSVEGQRSTTSVSSPSTQETSVPVLVKSTTPAFSQVRTNFIPIPDKAKPLGVPLLNLDGPPELIGKPGTTSDLNCSRKKRKRRRKRKNQIITGTGECSH